MGRLRPFLYGCCLLIMLVASCVVMLMLTRVTPLLDAWWEKIRTVAAETAEEEVDYFDWVTYPYLPGDVVLSDQLKEMAPEYGFTEYDIQAMIAGAARYGIRWEDVVAIQINAQWDEWYVDMFILSISIAKFLDEHGYNDEPPPCPEPTAVPPSVTPEPGGCIPINPRYEAIKAMNPAGGEEWLYRVLATSDFWAGPLHTAEIDAIEPEDLFDLFVIYMDLLSYQVHGYYDVLVIVDGQPVIISDPNAPAIPYPGEIEGFFVHPFPGSWITGYDFGDPVYNEKGELIRAHHPGIDLGGIGRDPVYAAHDGQIIYAGWMNSGSLWISGIVVAIKGTYPDGTPVCTLYGHGEKGSLRVGVGDPVSAGDQLMIADDTGVSSGDHLHFDLRFGDGTYCGQSVDPKPYID